jgi:hypothetical protein
VAAVLTDVPPEPSALLRVVVERNFPAATTRDSMDGFAVITILLNLI